MRVGKPGTCPVFLLTLSFIFGCPNPSVFTKFGLLMQNYFEMLKEMIQEMFINPNLLYKLRCYPPKFETKLPEITLSYHYTFVIHLDFLFLFNPCES